MNKRIWLWGGVVIGGLILISLLWPAKPPAPRDIAPVKLPARPVIKYVHHLKRSPAESPPPIVAPATPPAETNAASIYRQVIALYDGLSQSNKDIFSDWQVNVDSVMAEELCEKLRPIVNLLHQASAVTNCDWGLGPLEPTTPLTHLAPARALGRAVIWSAAHCRRDDAPAATADVLSTLRLGQQVANGAAIIGYLVDLKIQELAWFYVAANLDQFSGAAGQKLIAAFDDLAYDDAFSRAMFQEADFVDRFAAKLAALPPAEAAKQWQQFGDLNVKYDPATLTDGLKQLASFQRELTKVLATGSAAKFDAWLRRAEELQATSAFVKDFLPSFTIVEKAQGYEINRALVVAGLAVAANGPAGLTAHPDPSTGGPFAYRAVLGGFELQSTYQINNQPLKIVFRQQIKLKEAP